MVSELQRIAEELIGVIDELPKISGLLHKQIQSLDRQASELGTIANRTGDLRARDAAMQLHDAARKCGRAADAANRAHRMGRQWVAEKVGDTGGSRSPASGGPRADSDVRVRPSRDQEVTGGTTTADDLPTWRRRMMEGRRWHTEQQQTLDALGGTSELYLMTAQPNRYFIVDHYNRAAGMILSMKHTQLADIKPETARSYLLEAIKKYPPDTVIADVPSTPTVLRGQPLRGELYLHVPVQKKPVPQELIDFARTLRPRIQIRDEDGRIYG